MDLSWNIGHAAYSDTGAVQRLGYRSFKVRNLQLGGVEQDVVIRLAANRSHVEAACDLINQRYAWRGYGDHHLIDLVDHQATFTAEIDDEVVGTITLAVDSISGLAVDRTFPEETSAFRNSPGAKICELTKFAFDPAVQSKPLMAALFHAAFVYGQRTYGCTDLLIEVNPRHVRFYEAMLGFERAGALSHNCAVGAPSQLMRLKVDAIRANINAHAGSPFPEAKRSLYPFFLPRTYENAMYDGLAGTQIPASQRSSELDPAWLERTSESGLLAA